MKVDYRTAQKIRKQRRNKTVSKSKIMETYKLSERAYERLISHETYLGPIKKRKKNSNVHGEMCGRSKLKEKDIKCIRFYYGILSNCEQARYYGVYHECIKKIGERLSWKHVK